MKSNAMKYDPISYIEDLRKAGFNEEQAKAQAKGLFLVVEEQGVTKRDLKESENATKNNIKELETKLSYDFKELHSDMKAMETRLLLKLGSLMILLSGLLGPYIKILLS